MKIDVSGSNVEVSTSLNQLVNKSFAKINKKVPDDTHCEIIVSKEQNPKIRAAQKAEANLHVKGGTINAKSYHETMEGAISHVANEIIRQLNRRKERGRSKKRAGAQTIRHS